MFLYIWNVSYIYEYLGGIINCCENKKKSDDSLHQILGSIFHSIQYFILYEQRRK